MTIGFDHFHTHFGRFGLERPEAFNRASEFIQSILNEEVLVYSFMRNGSFGGAGCVGVNNFPSVLTTYEISYTRSWLGTYDKRYTP